MKTDTSKLARIATIVGFALGAFALAAVADNSWTQPGSTPPGGNIPAPINVGGGGENGTAQYGQTKTGLLSLGNFLFNHGGVTVPVGSVLTAQNTDGLVGWGEPIIPYGAIVPFAIDRSSSSRSNPCPDGWAEYPAARGRTIIGSGAKNSKGENQFDLTTRTLGTSGGQEQNVIANVASHTHSIPLATISYGYGGLSANVVSGNGGSGITGPTGSNFTISNMPPWVAGLYCIKLNQ